MAVDDSAPYLDPSPAAWAASGLAWLLLALFATLAVGLVAVRVPDTVDASFVLVARRAADPLRVLHDGVVASVLVTEAQAVADGAPLFVIESEPATDRWSERQTLAASLEGGARRLVNERAREQALRLADDEERLRLIARLDNLERQAVLKARELTLAREVVQRQEQSFREGLSAWIQASEPKLAADRIELELEQIRSDLAEARSTLARLAHEADSRRSAFAEAERGIQEELSRAELRKRALDAESTSGRAIAVTAPCDAVVVRMHVQHRGAVVHAGDAVADVVCSGVRLEAQLALPQRGLALVRPGQRVKLLYEAFPYERFGARYATLRWISPTAAGAGTGTAFLAIADLNEDAVDVHGQRRPLLPGMAGRASIIVGRRSLASYAFAPLRQVREAFATGPGR